MTLFRWMLVSVRMMGLGVSLVWLRAGSCIILLETLVGPLSRTSVLSVPLVEVGCADSVCSLVVDDDDSVTAGPFSEMQDRTDSGVTTENGEVRSCWVQSREIV